MIDYTLTSMATILRDYIDVRYIDKEHQMLCDIADSIYNADIRPEDFTADYKELYDAYGASYFDKVLDDMYAIDSQLTGDRKALELEEDYYDRVGDVNFREDWYGSEGSMDLELVDFAPYRTTPKAYKLFKESGLYLFHRGYGDGDPNSAYYLSPDPECRECWHIGDTYGQVTDYFENKWENDPDYKRYGGRFAE